MNNHIEKLRNEVAKQLTGHTFYDEFECADSIIKTVKDANVERLVMCDAEKICIDIYMCFHVSELTTLHEPTCRAWKLGQKLYEKNKNNI